MGLIDFIHSYQPTPVLFQFGSLAVHWYGFLLAVGITAGYFVTRSIWRQQARSVKEFDDLMIWLVIGGLLGARLLDVFIYEWWYFKDHLNEISYIWQGGLAWHGGLLGGAVILWWWSKKIKYSFWEILDSFAPGLALGQAVGRWGNYFNQELFGLPTSLPWGIPIAQAARPENFTWATHFHPTFFYESIALIMIAYVLWRLSQKIKSGGRIFAAYLILAGLLRFVLEFLRVDEQNIYLGWRAGLWLATMTVVLGLWLWYKRRLVAPKDTAEANKAAPK